MRFAFNERKTAQAMAYVLKRHRGHMSYMVAIKTLYLADRKSLIEVGRPITGDWMVALPQGPSLSMTLNLVRETAWAKGGTSWREYIVSRWYGQIGLAKREPERDELSDFELQMLEEADREVGWMNRSQISDYSHRHWPEWSDPGNSSRGIDPEEILRLAEKTPEEIDAVSRRADEIWLFESLSRAGRSA